MMRKPTAYILLLLVACALLAGCGRSVSDADRLLARIDSLADVDPDSADVLLKPTPSPSPKGWEKDEVALLLRIKVDDKLYRPVTHYRDTILRLISYFEQHPKVLPSVLGSTGPALPYLYAGRIFADLGDAPQALDYYQRALDVQPAGQMENEKLKIENEDVRRLAKQRGLLHSLIGTIFSYQHLYDESVDNLIKANVYARLSRDTIDMFYNYRDLAFQYKSLCSYDSCFYYYQHALDLAKAIGNDDLCHEANIQIAALYNKTGQHEKALTYLRPLLTNIDSFSISAVYSIAAESYTKQCLYDTANYYLNELLRCGNIYGKRYAYQEISNNSLIQGKTENAYVYLQKYKLLDDSIRKMENAETVARMHAAYNYQKHERRAFELELSNARKEKLIIIILSFITTLSGVLYLYYKQYTKRQNAKTAHLRQVIEEKERQSLARQEEALKKVSELAKQIEELQQISLSTNEHHQAELRSLAAEKAQLLFMLKKQKDADDVKKMGVDAIMSSPSYRRFVELDNERKNTPKLSEWNDLSDEVAKFFPNFEKNLKGSCKMSNQQYRACLLRMLKFGPSSASYLCCYGKSSISSLYTRLYEKITGKKGSMSDFDTLLESFLHD